VSTVIAGETAGCYGAESGIEGTIVAEAAVALVTGHRSSEGFRRNRGNDKDGSKE